MESCRYKIIRMIKSRRIKNPYNNECRIANPTQLATTGTSATTGAVILQPCNATPHLCAVKMQKRIVHP